MRKVSKESLLSPIGSCVISKSTDPLKLAEGEEEEVCGEDTLD